MKSMFRRIALLFLCFFALFAAPQSHADSYALLIGIDTYQNADAINGLAGASNDAKALAQTLEQIGGFPADHVRLLTSDGDTKPTKANIAFELDQLAGEVKPGDLVFVLFSGHGIEQDGATYLVPYDADVRTDTTLRYTALPEADVRAQLSRIPAKGLILAFDMCRSDPRKGEKGIAQDNLMTRQARDLRIVPSSEPAADQSGPRAVVTLFSCSPNERSWEWQAKGRGYFCYYLEQGLRHEAADGKGVVRVSALISYLEKAVPSAVARQEGEGRRQTPYTDLEGNGAGDLVLARVLPGAKRQEETAAFLTPGPAVDTLQVRFEQALTEGRSLCETHQWDAAQRKYAAALDLKPDSAKATAGLGEADAGLKRWSEAERLFRQAAALDPKLPDAVNGLGLIAFKNHRYDEAEQLVRQAQLLGPKDPEVFCNLGYLNLIVKHDYAAAGEDFRRAMALDAADADYPVGLGVLYFRKGDVAQSEKFIRQALDLNPKDSQAADYLGSVLLKKGDAAGAEQWYRKAIALDPSDAQPVTDLAGLEYGVKHDPDEAGELFHQAMSLDPLDVTPVLGLAQMFLMQKDAEQADRYARNAREIDPKDGDPLAVLAVLAMQKHDFSGAEDLCRQAIALDGTQGVYYEYLAATLIAQGRRDEALPPARKAIALGDKGTTGIYQMLGLTP